MYSRSEAEVLSMFYKNLSVELGITRDGSTHKGANPTDFAAIALVKTLDICKMEQGSSHNAGDYHMAAKAIKAVVDAYSAYLNKINQRCITKKDFDEKA